jgi:hypothetical protein
MSFCYIQYLLYSVQLVHTIVMVLLTGLLQLFYNALIDGTVNVQPGVCGS